jgi:hypothetical protein
MRCQKLLSHFVGRPLGRPAHTSNGKYYYDLSPGKEMINSSDQENDEVTELLR